MKYTHRTGQSTTTLSRLKLLLHQGLEALSHDLIISVNSLHVFRCPAGPISSALSPKPQTRQATRVCLLTRHTNRGQVAPHTAPLDSPLTLPRISVACRSPQPETSSRFPFNLVKRKQKQIVTVVCVCLPMRFPYSRVSDDDWAGRGCYSILE